MTSMWATSASLIPVYIDHGSPSRSVLGTNGRVSPFFTKLARELRDKIYGYIWSEAPVILQRYKRKWYTVSYGTQPVLEDLTRFQAKWLLTNQQMLLEGLAEFHQRSVWYLGDRKSPRRLLPCEEYVFPLITPGLVHAHHLYIYDSSFVSQRRSYFRQDHLKQYQYLDLRQEAVTHVNCMTTSMEVPEGVQEIKVTVVQWGNFTMYEFHLFTLERLAVHRGVRSFHAEIDLAYVSSSERANQALLDEFERVGKLLVNGALRQKACKSFYMYCRKAMKSARLPVGLGMETGFYTWLKKES
ncbi:hypothetical protein BDW02DRAFT_599092 [Decorospora gaudefroyi]|uniref:Uncharacterized protein n=1 Tax=Decorospora gaudefroyi TaxID=184978 RepID=A0A6A5KA06_9PLEO|nr:hypothetical protein BDW02DRAFT_599092 [Decorospora gaudefroyi]